MLTINVVQKGKKERKGGEGNVYAQKGFARPEKIRSSMNV